MTNYRVNVRAPYALTQVLLPVDGRTLEHGGAVYENVNTGASSRVPARGEASICPIRLDEACA
jgi:hypothetical protein